MLYDAWLQSNESWQNSKLLEIIRSKNSHAKKAIRVWLTFSEMEKRWGSDVASAMRDRKLDEPRLRETEVRKHPDRAPRQRGQRVDVIMISMMCGAYI